MLSVYTDKGYCVTDVDTQEELEVVLSKEIEKLNFTEEQYEQYDCVEGDMEMHSDDEQRDDDEKVTAVEFSKLWISSILNNTNEQ